MGTGSGMVRTQAHRVKTSARGHRRDGGELHLFTHADLHDGVADQRFSQVFVFLLLEPLDVFPGRSHKLPGETTADTTMRRR